MVAKLVAVLCVVFLAAGQILFKLSAISLAKTHSYFALQTSATLVGAMALYAIASVAWVWVLQDNDLGRIYPFMALAFAIVPIGSFFVFGERFQAQYFVGVALIVVGIVLALRA